MPLAVLIAPPGDVRDAVGLFLAGLGWTTVPAVQAADGLEALIAAVEPLIVAVDFRGDADAALECAAVAARTAGAAEVYLLNVPDPLRGVAAERAAGSRLAEAADDLPRAPGVPGPPH